MTRKQALILVAQAHIRGHWEAMSVQQQAELRRLAAQIDVDKAAQAITRGDLR